MHLSVVHSNLKKKSHEILKVYQVNNRTFFQQCLLDYALDCVLVRASWDHPSGVAYAL